MTQEILSLRATSSRWIAAGSFQLRSPQMSNLIRGQLRLNDGVNVEHNRRNITSIHAKVKPALDRNTQRDTSHTPTRVRSCTPYSSDSRPDRSRRDSRSSCRLQRWERRSRARDAAIE